MQRPTTVTVFAILNIVFAVIGVVGVLATLAMFSMTDGAKTGSHKATLPCLKGCDTTPR